MVLKSQFRSYFWNPLLRWSVPIGLHDKTESCHDQVFGGPRPTCDKPRHQVELLVVEIAGVIVAVLPGGIEESLRRALVELPPGENVGPDHFISLGSRCRLSGGNPFLSQHLGVAPVVGDLLASILVVVEEAFDLF